MADLVDGDVHGRGDGLVEPDELAAHEEVGDLVLQRAHGGEGVGGLVPEGEDFLRAGRLPGRVVREGGVESFDMVRGDAIGAAAVRGLADLLGNRGNERG